MLYSAFSMNKPNTGKTNPLGARKMIVTKRKYLAVKAWKMRPVSYNSVILLRGSKRVTKKYYSNRCSTRKWHKCKLNLPKPSRIIRRNLACTREIALPVWALAGARPRSTAELKPGEISWLALMGRHKELSGNSTMSRFQICLNLLRDSIKTLASLSESHLAKGSTRGPRSLQLHRLALICLALTLTTSTQTTLRTSPKTQTTSSK